MYSTQEKLEALGAHYMSILEVGLEANNIEVLPMQKKELCWSPKMREGESVIGYLDETGNLDFENFICPFPEFFGKYKKLTFLDPPKTYGYNRWRYITPIYPNIYTCVSHNIIFQIAYGFKDNILDFSYKEILWGFVLRVFYIGGL